LNAFKISVAIAINLFWCRFSHRQARYFSLRKPSMVFALQASLSAVQIRS